MICCRCGTPLFRDNYGYRRGFGYYDPLCKECGSELLTREIALREKS